MESTELLPRQVSLERVKADFFMSRSPFAWVVVEPSMPSLHYGPLFKLKLLFIISVMYGCAWHGAHTWRSEDSLEVVSFYFYMGFVDLVKLSPRG